MLDSASRIDSVAGFSISFVSLKELPSMETIWPPLSYGGRLYAMRLAPSMRSGVIA